MLYRARSVLLTLVMVVPLVSLFSATSAEARAMFIRPGWGGGWHGGWGGGGWHGGWGGGGWHRGCGGWGWRGGGWRGGGWGWRGGGCGWGGCGWGWGAPFAAGVAGSILGAALVAPSYGYGYGYPSSYGYGYGYPYYAPTYYAPSCYWSRQRVYDYRGRLIGRRVQICN
jgi:hypothetical protein